MSTENEQPTEEKLEAEEIETQTEQTQEQAEEQEDGVFVSKAEYNKMRRQAMAYQARKSEEKQEPRVQKEVSVSSFSEELVEEKILKSEGVDEELLKEMKILAKLRGVSLLETKKDPIILAMKEEKAKEERARQAALGASKGSGRQAAKKDFNTPGLTREEHKALWKERFSNR